MNRIAEFVNKKRVICDTKRVELKEIKVPWYRRPLDHSEFFSREGKDGKFYVHHKEWAKRVWIGPYDNITDAKEIINSYVLESCKDTLDKKPTNNIHSIIVENESNFFKHD